MSRGKEKIQNPKAVQINYNGKIKEKKVFEYLQGEKFQLLK